MNVAFNIRSQAIDTGTSQLLVEVGPGSISFVVVEGENSFSTIVVYNFTQGLPPEKIAEEIKAIVQQESSLNNSFKKTNIIWNFKESILVPAEFFNSVSNTEMLNLVYGDVGQYEVKTDFVFRHNMHNVYRLPKQVVAALPATWQYAHQTHQYSLLPDLAEKTGDCLMAIFYSNSFTVMLTKAGKLQVIQHFDYQNADDVAYHLLNICNSFAVKADEAILHVSGMIDTGSNLYATLYKYFLNIELASLPANAAYSDEIKSYPAHFFSHLFTLALCV